MKLDISILENTPRRTRMRRLGSLARTNAGTIRLSKGSTLARRWNAGEIVLVRARAGIVWVTMEGDAKDYVLSAGEHAEFDRHGLLVVEGLEAENAVELLATDAPVNR